MLRALAALRSADYPEDSTCGEARPSSKHLPRARPNPLVQYVNIGGQSSESPANLDTSVTKHPPEEEMD